MIQDVFTSAASSVVNSRMTIAVRWSAMSSAEVAGVAARLAAFKEDVSVKQHPCFAERFRRPLSKPVFLKCLDGDGAMIGFLSLIRLGFAGVKCGFALDGPVFFERLDPGLMEVAARSLADRLRSLGYAFVRFTHRDEDGMDSFLNLPEATTVDPLPFVLRFGGELLISLDREEEKILAGFQQVARQEIKKATQAGCEVRQSTSRAVFLEVWPKFVTRAKIKGIRVGSSRQYEAMFALNGPGDFAKFYGGYYDGEPVFLAVLLREASAAYYLLGALDATALGKRPSPACLVHWTAMRDYRNAGCSRYNLGTRSGSVYASKKKFRPVQAPKPSMATMILRPVPYGIWSRVVMPTIAVALKARNRIAGG